MIPDKRRRTVVGALCIGLLSAPVRLWQLLISPFLGENCRYYPSCSEYALQALSQHGALKGFWLALKRVLKCNALFPGGCDHVPPVNK